MKLMDTQKARANPTGTGASTLDVVFRGWLDYPTIGLAFLLFAAAMALYARTAAPGLLDGDEGEFQTNIFKLGVSHTGYPTFFMLGKLFTLLIPVGTMATRANLFSAFWGALAIVALFLFIRFLTRNSWAALFSSLLLLASRVEWSQAIIPRPYTLNSVFVIVVPLLFFLWRIGKINLTTPVFAFGLSLTNHRTIMWFGPAIAVFVLWADFDQTFGGARPTGSLVSIIRQWLARSTLFKPRRLIALVAAFVAPLLLYGYVWWRGESDVGVEFHWKDFNDEIMGGNVRAWWRFGPPGWLASRVTDLYVPMLVEQFTVFGFIAGIIGIVALALDKPPRGWNPALPAREVLLFFVLANLANSAFCVIFWVIDIDKFFLPSFLTFLFLAGVGIAAIWDWLAARPARRLPQALVALVFVGATGFLFWNNLPLNDWSGRGDTARVWDENLALPLEPRAIIAGSWESITPLEYAQYVEGRRKDLDRWKLLVKQYQMGMVPYGSRQEEIEKAVRAGRPVYLTVHPGETETLGALVDEFRLTRVGELWRVLDASPVDSATIERLKSQQPLQTFSDEDGHAVELVGYSVSPAATLQAGDFALATFFWRVRQSFAEHLSISLRLTDAQNQLVFQRDMEPASGMRPTNGWLPDEIVQDDAGFFVPPDAPPGVYHLTVVVYRTQTGENLVSEAGTSFALSDLLIASNPTPPSADILPIPHPLDLSIPPLRIRGYEIDKGNVKGGDVVGLSLWWQLDELTKRDEHIALSLRDASGRETELYAGAPISDYPTSHWTQPGIVRGRYALALPLEATGRAQLVIRSEDKSVELPPFNIQPSGRTFAIPPIGHPQTALIGDEIRLLGYDLDKASIRPGETVRLTLYWQAIRQPARGYTVFTHALDAAGVLQGQKDSIPRGGELPTDRWLPGEVVVDKYDIAIPQDAPSGSYQFEIGMYVAETGDRLPVEDANGTRIGEDRIVLSSGLLLR